MNMYRVIRLPTKLQEKAKEKGRKECYLSYFAKHTFI